jgi:tRNA pseudouridine38-40 synthase
MPRYALRIDYHGGPFAGWQRQAGGLASVQGAVEAALAKLEPGAHTLRAGRMPASMPRRRSPMSTLPGNGSRFALPRP